MTRATPHQAGLGPEDLGGPRDPHDPRGIGPANRRPVDPRDPWARRPRHTCARSTWPDAQDAPPCPICEGV